MKELLLASIPSPIKKYYNGEISLGKSYWLIAVPSGIIFRILGAETSLLFSFIGLLMFIYISIGLWRSATNYQKNLKVGERKYWGSIVQVLVIVNIIMTIIGLILV